MRSVILHLCCMFADAFANVRQLHLHIYGREVSKVS